MASGRTTTGTGARPGDVAGDERAGRFERMGAGRSRGGEPARSFETKSALKTTEFYAYVAASIGVLLAGLLTEAGDGHDDRLQAQDAWLIVGILTAAYMVSRGLAKAGSYATTWDEERGADRDRR
jgi:hypothetical protein